MMDDVILRLSKSLDYLMPWLGNYASQHQPAGMRDWRFRREPRHNYFHEGIQRQSGAFWGKVAAGGIDLPCIELHAKQQDWTCEVTLRCNDLMLLNYLLQLVKDLKDGSDGRILQKTSVALDEVTVRPMRKVWNTEVIREMLNAAFDDEALRTFCFDHFRPIYDDFAAGMSKGEKVQRLLEYCERQDQVQYLLDEVSTANPRQYARFEGQFTVTSGS